MAINVNKRKRKLENADFSPQVPQKVAKKSYKEDENKAKINNDDHADTKTSTPMSTHIEATEKFTKDFKMLNFRTKLKGTNFITELRHFLHLAENNNKIVVKYIEKRGKPLEIVEAIERIDSTNLPHITYLCQALQLVLMEIVSNHKTHMESAMHASRYFLKTYTGLVDNLLKSPQSSQRCIALKLLTAIVCVEPQLGRQVLSSFDVLSNVHNIQKFFSHKKLDVEGNDTVRKCFIHFVLSYLIEGNIVLIRNILDRSVIITALASGLVYDDQVTVCVVLSSLKKYVLENPEIPKTKKVNVFTLECCRYLIRLYDWRGPKPNKAQVEANEMTDSCEKASEASQAVAAAVHEFLLVLLTSRKHGIAFDAVKNFGFKRNQLQGKLIGSISTAWCSNLKTELILKILDACPELTRGSVKHFAGIINPMRTGHKHWVEAANFLTKLIDNFHPSRLNRALEQMKLTDFVYWIKELCFPIETLTLITGANMLRHNMFAFRLATARLLLAMFKQYSNFMTIIRKQEHERKVNTMRRFRFDILNHILVHFPTIEDILYALYLSIHRRDDDDVYVLEHLDVALDIVLVVCKENQTFVNKTSTILDYLELLRPLYANDESPEIDPSNIKLELKAIKTILLLSPKALDPKGTIFQSVLKSFIKGFVHGTPDVQRETGKVLHGIFENTGIFDSSGLEIDLWLEAIRFDPTWVDVVTQVLIEVLQVTEADVDLPTPTDTNASEQNIQNLFKNIDRGLSVQSYFESLSISKLMPLIFKGVEIAPPLSQYLELVCLLLFHYYPTPEHVLRLYELEFKELRKYMNSWISITKPELPLRGAIAAKVRHMREVQSAILDGQFTLKDIFCKADSDAEGLQLQLNGESVQLSALLGNERICMIVTQQVLFMVLQLERKGKLQRDVAQRASEFLTQLVLIALQQAPSEDDFTKDIKEECFVSKMMKYIFTLRIRLSDFDEIFQSVNESHINYLYFFNELMAKLNDLPQFSACTENVRLKIVQAIRISLENITQMKVNSVALKESLRFVESICLTTENCTDIMELLATHVKYNDLYIAETMQKSFYYELLVCVLHRVASLQKAIKCDLFVDWLAKVYGKLLSATNCEFSIEQLEEALCPFLVISHQYIERMGRRLLESVFIERKIYKSTVKLACLLLERNATFSVIFLEQLDQQMDKRELLYPLLRVVFDQGLTVPPTALKSVYQGYKNGFMKTIEKSQKAGAIYKENITCTLRLIEECMPNSECLDFCNKTFKFDAIEIYQMRMIHAIYRKAYAALDADNGAHKSTIFTNFINLQIQMLLVSLKKQVLEEQKIELFAYLLYNWWHMGDGISVDYARITKSQQWMSFCKSSLKMSMSMSQMENDASGAETQNGSVLLKLLSFLCDKLYVDYTASASGKTDSEAELPQSSDAAQLFDMIFTHSKFFDIILRADCSDIKTETLHLLFTLAKKNPSALSEKQIPIILGAYQAKLTNADRYALALLQLYETYDFQMQPYRPFIWGESAISFYALRASDDERPQLSQQETSFMLVMSLIDKQVCDYTVENFPIWRRLSSLNQMPQVRFADPDSKALEFGANELERAIESQDSATLKCTDPRLCPKRPGLYEQCYDPAFLIPLMGTAFASGSYTHTARPVQNGLVSVVFTALSSQDKEMRLAAACAQLRYRAHFEQSKFLERPLWSQMYENIQTGLSEFRNSWLQHRKNSGNPRVSLIPTLFIARSIGLMNEPLHVLYKSLAMYMRVKSTFDFQCVPEFNVLFYSDEVEHNVFRQFILEIIRDGVKCSSDLYLLVFTGTLKVLMGFYGTTMSTLQTKLLILSIFSTCVKIPATTKIMIENIGILSWLSSVVSLVEFYQFDIIAGIISILNNLWYAIKATPDAPYNYDFIMGEIHHLIMSLLPHLSTRISIVAFSKLMNIMSKTSHNRYDSMSAEQLDRLIGITLTHCPSHTYLIENIRRCGSSGVASDSQLLKELYNCKLDSKSVCILVSLRAYVIKWSKSQQREADSSLAEK